MNPAELDVGVGAGVALVREDTAPTIAGIANARPTASTRNTATVTMSRVRRVGSDEVAIGANYQPPSHPSRTLTA